MSEVPSVGNFTRSVFEIQRRLEARVVLLVRFATMKQNKTKEGDRLCCVSCQLCKWRSIRWMGTYHHKNAIIFVRLGHNIIQTHSTVMWIDNFMQNFPHIQSTYEEYFT